MSRHKRSTLQQAVLTLRKRLGLTQRKLAMSLNVTTVTICRWETTREPSGASLAQLAAFARSSGDNDLAKTFSRSFSQEFHFDEHTTLPRLSSFTPSSALMDLGAYRDHAAIAEQYRYILEQIERLHAVLVREAVADLQRAPSAAQARKVLELQQTHELLQQEMRNEKNRP